jgi:ATP-dependent Lon protease
LEEAMTGDRDIFLATQHDATIDEPSADQIYTVGTLGRILQAQRQENGQIKVVVEGRERGQSVRVEQDSDGMFYAHVRKVASSDESGFRTDGLLQKIHTLVEQFLRVSPDAYTDALHASLRGVSAAQIADSMSSHLRITVDEKQSLLETVSVPERLQKLIDVLENEIEKRQLDRSIHSRTKKQMDKHQREYYLNEQIKAIHKELGRKDDKAELDDLKKKIEEAGMTEEAKEKAMQEFSRLEAMPPMSAESTVSRTYLDWLINVPWKDRSDEIDDLTEAERVLNEDHYGLEKIKERILEFLAVRQLVANPKGTILCFVGAPGVGKTSLGKSIASSLGRKYVRISLGGVRDEAEVRGHRRTYIGALPGRIVAGLKKAGSMNPVFVLDEIDKLAADMRGDPAAAMLEVLDPEQNKDFVDHYVEVPVDLSKVMFICTANQLDTISQPLLDRMETVELSGYTTVEKLAIAKNHLVPKQLGEHGITKDQFELDDSALEEIIHSYTREAGVRNLEREIAAVCRGVAVKVAEGTEKIHVDKSQLNDLLGPVRHVSDIAERVPEVGVIAGLAWTPVGGEILFIEARAYPGKGDVKLTGQMGDVMRESATAAVSWMRSNAIRLGIDPEQIANHDLHIHLPQGAIKKDGPSAGVALTCAVVSVFTKRPIRNDIALTGEIDLRGHALPIGGVKEKVLAAHRAGMKLVFLPERNAKDILDIPEEIRNELEIRFMKKIDDALEVVLGPKPPASEPEPAIPPPTAPSRGSMGERLPS